MKEKKSEGNDTKIEVGDKDKQPGTYSNNDTSEK